MSQTPHSLIIKNRSIRWQEVFLIVLALALSIGPFVLDMEIFVSFMGLFLLAFTLIQLVPRLLDKGPQIIIDQRGIEFCKKQRLHFWNTTEYAYIKKEVEGSGRNSRTVHYFYIKSQGQKFKENISNLKFSAAEVRALIEYYGSGNVGDENDELQDDVAALMTNGRQAPEIVPMFKRYSNGQNAVGFISFLSVLGVSVYFQATTSHWYSVGIGFIASIVVCIFLHRLIESSFQQKELINTLSDREFFQISEKFGQRYSKKAMTGFMIFFALVAVGIFVISYFATRP